MWCAPAARTAWCCVRVRDLQLYNSNTTKPFYIVRFTAGVICKFYSKFYSTSASGQTVVMSAPSLVQPTYTQVTGYSTVTASSMLTHFYKHTTHHDASEKSQVTCSLTHCSTHHAVQTVRCSCAECQIPICVESHVGQSRVWRRTLAPSSLRAEGTSELGPHLDSSDWYLDVVSSNNLRSPTWVKGGGVRSRPALSGQRAPRTVCWHLRSDI